MADGVGADVDGAVGDGVGEVCLVFRPIYFVGCVLEIFLKSP